MVIKLKNPVLSGFLKGLLLMIIMGILVGLLMYNTEIPETFGPYLSLSILVLSVFMGGFWATRRAGARGLIIGLEVALIFAFSLLIVTLVFRPGYFSWGATMIKFLLVILAGVFGGMSGVAFYRK